MDRMNTCLSDFLDRLLMPHLFWEKSISRKSWVEEAIITVSWMGEKNRIRGKEAAKVHALLIDGSRLPLLRKMGTCGKFARPLPCCRDEGGRCGPGLPTGENQRREAGVSCYLCLRGKLRALGGSFPQRHKSEEVILFNQP